MGIVFKNAEKLKFKAHTRFLVLDPCAGTIIRFKKREDFPLDPKFKINIFVLNLLNFREVLPLKNMKEVKKIPKIWYFSKKLQYFQITFLNKKNQIFGCKTETAVEKWISHINEAKNFYELNMLKNIFLIKIIKYSN